MKIAFDLDDVLANTNAELIKFHNEMYGSNFCLSDFRSYNLWETWGGSRDEAIQKVFVFYKTPNFQNLTPFLGVADIVKELAEKHELIIVTSRPNQIKSETEAWVDNHFPNCFSKVILSKYYPDDTEAALPKDQICAKENVETIVEDCLHWACECSARGIKAVILDKPWNRHNNADNSINSITRIKHHQELLTVLR